MRLCTSGGAPLPREWLAAFHEATGPGSSRATGSPRPARCHHERSRPPAQAGLGRPRAARRRAAAGGRDGDPLDARRRGGPEDDDDLGDGSDPADDTGLVALRGPNLFSGYWPDGAGGPDADGWFRTADVGFLDADGDLHLVDRSSDLVIVNGFNVYPREVEQVLAELDGGGRGRGRRACPTSGPGEAVKAVLVAGPAAS